MKKRIFFFIFIITIILNCYPAQAQSDVKIITHLDHYKFLNPAITENNTYCYNNFEIYLYSNKNNTDYEIEINNIMIANGTIKNFMKTIYYTHNSDNISLMIIRVGEDYYNYSSIIVFNVNIIDDDNKTQSKYDIMFTEMEFKNYVNKLKLKLFSADSVGWISGIIISYVFIKDIKKEQIQEI